MNTSDQPIKDSIPQDSCYNFLEQNDISPLTVIETDSFEIQMRVNQPLPYRHLNNHQNLIGQLVFTSFFLIIFAFIRLRGKNLFHHLLNVLIKRKKIEPILNDGISSNLLFYLLSLCLSFSILAITITYMAQGIFIHLSTLYIFAGLLLYHFLLLLVVHLLGWTFNGKHITNEIIINLWCYHISTGLLVSPFVISAFFVESFAVMPLLKIVVFGIFLLIFLKIIRWIEILTTYKVSILYMILYLCALEIMPLLVLYKVAL